MTMVTIEQFRQTAEAHGWKHGHYSKDSHWLWNKGEHWLAEDGLQVVLFRGSERLDSYWLDKLTDTGLSMLGCWYV